MIPTARRLVVLAVGLTVAAGCIRLGVWQLDRLQERRQRNAELARALALPPLAFPDSAHLVFRDPERYRYRRVVARGRYDFAGEVILRGRAMDGQPGVHLVTPLRVAGDTTLLVNRGWAPSADAATLDPRPLAEPGMRVVEGILLAAPASGGGSPAPVRAPGLRVTSFARLPLDSIRAAASYPLSPLYLQQLPGGPAGTRVPIRVPLPAMGEGPHRGYAFQWFSFAVIALVGTALLWRRRDPGGS